MLNDIVSLNDIASDFTAPPPEPDDFDTIAAILGPVFYFIGGGAGMAAIGASAAVSRATAQSARVGVGTTRHACKVHSGLIKRSRPRF